MATQCNRCGGDGVTTALRRPWCCLCGADQDVKPPKGTVLKLVKWHRESCDMGEDCSC